MFCRKKGFSKKKVEGDNKTPVGLFELENLYYRGDRVKPNTNLKCIQIKKNMGYVMILHLLNTITNS